MRTRPWISEGAGRISRTSAIACDEGEVALATRAAGVVREGWAGRRKGSCTVDALRARPTCSSEMDREDKDQHRRALQSFASSAPTVRAHIDSSSAGAQVTHRMFVREWDVGRHAPGAPYYLEIR